MKSYTEAEMAERLNKMIEMNTQRQVAHTLGFTPQYINDILRGRRVFSAKLALSMGFEKLPSRFIRLTDKRSKSAA